MQGFVSFALWFSNVLAFSRLSAQAANATLLCLPCACLQAAPWSKTGGLGDVVGSLPIALAARGHRVMVVVPRYADYEDTEDTGVGGPLQGP